MADQLSQADIDALLDTFSAEGSEAEALARVATGKKDQAREVNPESYDFSHPDLLARDQVRSLRTLHEGYAQALAKRLSTELLTNVSASVISIDHLTYAEFLMLLPTPTVLSVAEVPQLHGNLAIELNPNVAFAFIDRLLGGEGKPLGRTRSLTAIEQGLMERVLEKFCQELSGVWAPLFPLDIELQAIEGNPELARVVGPAEMVVLVSMELRMNDVAGVMNLCLPYVVMEPAIQRLGQVSVSANTSADELARTAGALRSSVRGSQLQIDVELGELTLTLGDLLELEEGDVLRFHTAGNKQATLRVEGDVRARGTAGRSEGQLAFRVDEAYRPPGKGEER